MDIEKLLNEHFAEYKEYHIYALIILTLLIVVFQIIQTIFVTKKIEKFKNELRRSEIKFSRFNNLQIEALKTIYDQIVTFHYKNFRLFYPKYYTHDNLKTKAKDWQTEYNSIMLLFHREKILLTSKLKNEIKELESDFDIINTKLDEELKDLSLTEESVGSEDVQFIYGTQEEETKRIKSRIDNLNKIDVVKKSEIRIKNLRKSLEDYFENLTK